MSDVSLAQLQSICDEFGLVSRPHPEDQKLLVFLGTPHGTHLAVLRLDEEREVVQIRLPNLAQVPPERRAEVAKALCHINYFLVLGRFGLDLRDGEVEFELPVLYAEVGLTEGTLARSFGAILGTLEQHLPQLAQLVWSERTAEGVLGLEGSLSQPPSLAQLLERLQAAEEEEESGEGEQSA